MVGKNKLVCLGCENGKPELTEVMLADFVANDGKVTLDTLYFKFEIEPYHSIT